MKRTDVALLGKIPRDKAERLHAARVVVAAYCAPGKVATVASIAETTGFSEAQVREILASDKWDELVSQQILHQVAPVISRGMALVASIVDDQEESKHARMQAHRLALQTYETIMKHRPAHRSMTNEEAYDAFLESIPTAVSQVRDDLASPQPPIVLP